MAYKRFSGNNDLSDEEKQLLFDNDSIILDPPLDFSMDPSFNSEELAYKLFDNCIIGVYTNDKSETVAVYSEERLVLAHRWLFYGDGKELDISDFNQNINISLNAKKSYLEDYEGIKEGDERFNESLTNFEKDWEYQLYHSAVEFISHNLFPLRPGGIDSPILVREEFDADADEFKDGETVEVRGMKYVVSGF